MFFFFFTVKIRTKKKVISSAHQHSIWTPEDGGLGVWVVGRGVEQGQKKETDIGK